MSSDNRISNKFKMKSHHGGRDHGLVEVLVEAVVNGVHGKQNDVDFNLDDDFEYHTMEDTESEGYDESDDEFMTDDDEYLKVKRNKKSPKGIVGGENGDSDICMASDASEKFVLASNPCRSTASELGEYTTMPGLSGKSGPTSSNGQSGKFHVATHSENQNELYDVDCFSEYENSSAEVDTPDNSEDEEFESTRKRGKVKHKVYNPNSDIKDVKFEPGLRFESRLQFKQVVQQYAIAYGFNIRWSRSCQERMEAVCVQDCPWRIYASWMQREMTFIVKFYNEQHKCSRELRNRQATCEWLTREYLNKFRHTPDWDVTEMQRDVQEKYTLTVSKGLCYRAKWRAAKELRGSLSEHYNKLPSYIAELKKENTNSLFKLEVDNYGVGGVSVFKRLYIGFEGLRNGFLQGCRPVIGLDGCFLKTFLGGQLLSAVGRDGNNQMFPFAWAVVEGENEASWTWFLKLLLDDLGIQDGYGWTILSDQQKGLENAVRKLTPHAEHRNCARHIYANWKKKNSGHVLKILFWRAVKSTTEVDFQDAMNDMKEASQSTYDDFMKIGKHKFCQAFINTWPKCEVVDNNISETFNGFILKARTKHVIDMLEDIRTVMMERMNAKRNLMLNSLDEICPRIRAKLEKNKLHTNFCFPISAGELSFQVEEKGDRYKVDLRAKSCSCRAWDLSGIPCNHAISCINLMRMNPDDYVMDCFKKETYLRAYSCENLLRPMNGPRMWMRVQSAPIVPPLLKSQPGRPKKIRKKDKHEDKQSDPRIYPRKGLDVKCSLCKNYGHNKRSCTLKGATSSASSSNPVRKRGRPPKQQSSQQVNTPSQFHTDVANIIQQSRPRNILEEEKQNSTVRKRGRPPKAANTLCKSKSGQPPSRRLPNSQISGNCIKRSAYHFNVHKEINQAKKGYGVLSTESGNTYIVMPNIPMQTSYVGNYGGQFTKPSSSFAPAQHLLSHPVDSATRESSQSSSSKQAQLKKSLGL